MNIREAKNRIKQVISSYIAKDENGECLIPSRRRRPVLLMGPPGIGKTAIMEQIAEELDINIVSYTITHHTRQSAIGLPVVKQRSFGGEEFDITEYTMSEIIAEVYSRIEESGNPNGILFLDEINCVSETLAPTMLQFLQYKTFGTHSLPDGFVIICAGNPREYNRSVRDFDLVTLDRVLRMDVSEDYEAWKEFASEAMIHGSITAFLDIKRDCFYSVSQTAAGTQFVTARGWEDLSGVIIAFEKLDYELTEDVVRGFLQSDETARDFTLYYELYNKYEKKYRVPDIISGDLIRGDETVKDAPFDEKVSLLHLLFDALNNRFKDYENDLRDQIRARNEALMLKEDPLREKDFIAAKADFEKVEQARQDEITETDRCLSNVFQFLVNTFGEGHEMVIFMTYLSSGFYSKKYLSDVGSDAYEKYDRLLLMHDEMSAIKRDIMKLE